MVPTATTIDTYTRGEGRQTSSLLAAARFVGRNPSVVALISLALLVPCIWHPRIEAGDLASHIYNAWLAMLIRAGKAPGLWLVPKATNVLFDIVLTKLAGKLGFVAAQRIAVGISVLVFFWGAFATAHVISGELPWSVVPVLAIITYGADFHYGLFNYYLSLGLSLCALAILWKPVRWDFAAAAVLLVLAFLAQPLAPLWCLGTIAYMAIARRLSPRQLGALFAAVFAALLVLREAFTHLFHSLWGFRQALYVTGADQVVFFGRSYRLFFAAILLLWGSLLFRLVRSRGLRRVVEGIPFQLYTLCAIGIFLLPDNVRLPWYGCYYGGITQRFSLIAAVLMCALLLQAKPARWHVVSLSAVAVAYFALLYVDTGAINALEGQVEQAVRQLPPGQRVVGHFYYPPPHTADVSMILDRACLGRCFSYGNYEPATLQFRVRAVPGNSIVAWDNNLPVATQYFMAAPGQSLYEISRCSPSATQVCVRALGREDTMASLR
jgi:hypothetical protein